MSISEQIQNIIHNRFNNLAPKFASLNAGLQKVEHFMLMPLLNTDEGWNLLMRDNPQASKLWESLENEISKLKECIVKDVLTIDDGKPALRGLYLTINNRITKDVLEICIMGPISTGKSTLMQALTGAPSYLIPTGPDKVTSARTSFRNSETQRAKIYFYSISEFREILNEFVHKLNIYLNNKGKDYTPFKSWDEGEDLSIFISDIKSCSSYDSSNFVNKAYTEIGNQAVHKYFESFQDYIDGYSQYSAYLGKSSVELDSTQLKNGELIPFVSYLGGKDNKKSYLGLLVKEAIVDYNINPELGKIILVDTMGIGEARYLIEEDLLSTINERADLGIALCKINSNSDGYESGRNTEFLSLLAAPELQERRMEDWIYYACNLEYIKDNPITEERINAFKQELYNDVDRSQLPLSRNKFASFNFGTLSSKNEVVPNKEGAYAFLSEKVLKGVEKVVSSLDDFLILKATKHLEGILLKIDQIYASLTKIKDLLPDTNNLSDRKRITKEVDKVCNTLYDEMEILSRQVEEENNVRRKRVKESIFPILCKPEILIHAIQEAERFKINVSEEKAALSIFDFSNNGEDMDEDEFSERMEAVFYIFRNISSICEKLIKDGVPERRISFKKVYEILKSELESVDNSEKDNVWQIEFDTLNSQKELVESIYKLSLRIISTLKYSMSSQTDSSLFINGEETQFEDTVGRELKNFYEYRELILKGIRKRIDSVEYTYANQTEKKSLGSYFNDETQSVITRIAKVLYQGIIGDNKVINYVAWLRDLAPKEQYPNLNIAISKLINTHIDLFKIAISKQKDTYLKTLLNVDVSYTNETEAAYSFYSNLFEIDHMLRLRLYEMFIDSFTDSKLYENEIMEFEKGALGMFNQRASRTDAYEELRDIISLQVEEKLATSDEYKKGMAYKSLLQILESR